MVSKVSLESDTKTNVATAATSAPASATAAPQIQKPSEAFIRVFMNCGNALFDQGFALSKMMSLTAIDMKSLSNVENLYQDYLAATQDIDRIAVDHFGFHDLHDDSSDFAEEASRANGTQAQYRLLTRINFNKQSISADLKALQMIQKVFSKDSELKKELDQDIYFGERLKRAIYHRFSSLLESFRGNRKLEVSDDQLVCAFHDLLKILLKNSRHMLLKEEDVHISSAWEHLFYDFFFRYYFTSPKETVEILQMCGDRIQECIDANKNELQCLYAVRSICKESISLKDVAQNLRTFRNILTMQLHHFDPRLINMEAVHNLRFYLMQPEAFKTLFTARRTVQDQYPFICGFFHEFERHAAPEASVALTKLLKFPDIAICLNNLFFYGFFPRQKWQVKPGALTPTLTVKFGNLLAFMNHHQLVKNEVSIIDFIATLILEKPLIAECLLSLVPKKFALLAAIFEGKRDVHDITEQGVRETLKKHKEEELAKRLFDLSGVVEGEIIKLSHLRLNDQTHSWLDSLLKIYEIENKPEFTMQDKLQRLPVRYTHVLRTMLNLSRNDGDIMLELVQFASKHPSTRVITKYLDKVNVFTSALNDAEIQKAFLPVLKAYNILVDAFPNLLVPLLSIDMSEANAYASLLRDNPKLLSQIIDLHPQWLNENRLKAISADKGIQEGLTAAMEWERKNEGSLLPVFENALDKLKTTRVITAVVKDPEFGMSLGRWFSELNAEPQDENDKIQSAALPKYDYLALVETSLKDRPEETTHLVKVASGCSTAFHHLFSKFAVGEPVEFLTFAKSAQPIDVQRMLNLMKWNRIPLATQLMNLFKTNPELAHRLLDMACSGFDEEASTLLKMSAATTKDELTKRLLTLAGSIHGPLIRKVLQLDAQNDKALIQIFLEASQKGLLNLFRNLLVLRARGDEGLFKRAMEIYPTADKQNPILKAIDEGRFFLANQLIAKTENSAKPIPALSRLQKSTEMLQDWAAIDKKTLLANEIEQVEKELLPFIATYSHSCKSDIDFCFWIGSIQFLLQHNPKRLLQLLTDKEWQKKDLKAVWDVTNDVETIVATRLRSEVDQKEISEKNVNVETASLSIALAECLVTPSGLLNHELVEILLGLKVVQQSKNPFLRDHLQHVLSCFREHLDFQERLRSFKQVQFPSLQHTLIAEMMKQPTDKMMCQRTAIVAMVSVFLWPLRQASIDSCFTTSTFKQLASTADGLSQLLEFLMSLLEKGFIQKKQKGQKDVDKYSLVIDKQPLTKKSEEENRLARALEYTIASFSRGRYLLKNHLDDLWDELFLQPIAKQIKFEGYNRSGMIDGDGQPIFNKKSLECDPFFKEVHATLIQNLRDATVLAYNAYWKHAAGNKTGAWVVVDSMTGEFLQDSHVAQNMYQRVLQSTKQVLLSKYSKNADVLNPLFDVTLTTFVQSDKFKFAVFEGNFPKHYLSGLSMINPLKYMDLRSRTPFLYSEEGGNIYNLMGSLHGSEINYGVSGFSKNPFEIFERHVFNLTDRELDLAKRNPNYLRIAFSKGHIFNFKINAFREMLQKENALAIWRSQSDLLEKIENSALTPELSKEIVETFLKFNLEEAATHLKHVLEPRVKTCRTVRDLCDVLRTTFKEVRGEDDITGVFADIVEGVLRTPKYKFLFPEIAALFDINWSGIHGMGFQMRIYDRNVRRIFFQNGVNYPPDWNPGSPDMISFPLYSDSTDALDRNYNRS